MEDILEVLNNNSIIIGLLISFIGGIVASFSPCAISSISIIIGYLSKNNDKKNNIMYSLIFSIGTIITFMILGVISAVIGSKIDFMKNNVNLVLSIVLIIVSLVLFGFFDKNKKETCKIPHRSTNIINAFVLGIMGAFISSPCTAPILIAIMSYTAAKGNLIQGIFYMLAYSIGSVVIIVITGISSTFIQKITLNEKFKNIEKILKIILGLIILVIGLYYLYLWI